MPADFARYPTNSSKGLCSTPFCLCGSLRGAQAKREAFGMGLLSQPQLRDVSGNSGSSWLRVCQGSRKRWDRGETQALLFHVYNDVVRPAGQELFRRYVVGIFLDVPHVGRHE